MIRAIILDFDGVILESVSVKTDAFRSLFSFCPDKVDAIVRFHLQNGGMSRFDKFDYIYHEILKIPLSEVRKTELSKTFAELVFQNVCTAPYVAGAYEFIVRISPKIPLYIVSATPEDELKKIVQHRGLDPYFRGVYGAPRKKTSSIEEIIRLKSIHRNETVFVGDAGNDLAAARETGIRFIGRITEPEGDILSHDPYTEITVTDLYGLLRYIGANA